MCKVKKYLFKQESFFRKKHLSSYLKKEVISKKEYFQCSKRELAKKIVSRLLLLSQFKAFSAGLKPIYNHIDVCSDAYGSPHLKFSSEFKELLLKNEINSVFVSFSYESIYFLVSFCFSLIREIDNRSPRMFAENGFLVLTRRAK